jgi:Fe-S oxidoreductase
MARMKIEYLAQYRQKHPASLRERAIAWLPRYAPYASAFSLVTNLLQDAAKPLIGFATARKLPRWRRDHFVERAWAKSGSREVVLFVDTFNRYFEPENARAAIRVLEAAGCRVHVAEPVISGRALCCGRTFLSVGLIAEAKREAQRLLEALEPWARRGVPILGLEPSCLYTLRDEYPALMPGAEAVAKNAMLFEEWLAREPGDLKLREMNGEALLHGHCHQKAFDAMPAVQKVLAMVPGLKTTLVESSCCGMAGSFGYEAEHYEVSMKMAGLSLLPAVRAKPQAMLVADGTSCRHQIAHGTGREARHVARLLEAALNETRAAPSPATR